MFRPALQLSVGAHALTVQGAREQEPSKNSQPGEEQLGVSEEQSKVGLRVEGSTDESSIQEEVAAS